MEFFSVLAVLAALAASAHFLKRSGRLATPARRFVVEQRISIANGCQLVLLRFDNEEILLAASSTGCTLLTTRTSAPAPPPTVIELLREHRACAG